MSKHNNALSGCVWIRSNFVRKFVQVLSNTDLYYMKRNITMRRYTMAIFTNAYSNISKTVYYIGVMTPWPSWPRFDTYHLSVHCNTPVVFSFPLLIKEREKVLRNCSKLNHVQKAGKKHLFPQEKKIIFVFIRHKTNLSTA